MSRRVYFEDEADAEYRQAGRWYEGRRDGLGLEFFDAVDAAIRQLIDFPRIGTPVPRLPIGRLGTIADVAATVIYLVSPAGALVTGSVLTVDGGWTAQ